MIHTPRHFTRVIDKMKLMEDRIHMTAEKSAATGSRPDQGVLRLKSSSISSHVSTTFNKLTLQSLGTRPAVISGFSGDGENDTSRAEGPLEDFYMNDEPTQVNLMTKNLQTFLTAFSHFGSTLRVKVTHSSHAIFELIQDDFVAQYVLPNLNDGHI